MTNVGDKFVIEIADVYQKVDNGDGPETLYRMKGFNSLVFDEQGINKLERYNSEPQDTDNCLSMQDMIDAIMRLDDDQKIDLILGTQVLYRKEIDAPVINITKDRQRDVANFLAYYNWSQIASAMDYLELGHVEP